MMEAVGQLAVRVLRGERADSIPTSSPSLNVRQVDWRQLRRWGISEARVPAGTLVRFKEFSVWERYRIYILGAAAILLAQTALIAGLLVQRSRRRHAEEKVRGSQAELRTSYERVRALGVAPAECAGHRARADCARIARRRQPAGGAPGSRSRTVGRCRRRRGRRADRGGIEPRARDCQECARSVAPSASGQAPPDGSGVCPPRSATRAVTVRRRRDLHARQRSVNAFARPDVVSVPNRSGSAAERHQVQQGRPRVGASGWRSGGAGADDRRRWRGVRRQCGVGDGARPDQHEGAPGGDRRHARDSLHAWRRDPAGDQGAAARREGTQTVAV